MDTQAYAASGEPGITHGYEEPTMTFEPLEYSSSTSLRSPGLITPLGDSRSNTLLSNIRHQRQLSAPNFDYYSNADYHSRSPSPTKPGSHVRRQSQGMPLTGDGRAGRRSDNNSSAKYGTWLSPTPSSAADEAVSPNTTPKSSRSSIVTVDTTPKSATQSRFNFFASLTTRLTNGTPTTPQTPQEMDDEICNMDIESALFPSPIDRDSFSPAAYKNLQTNAAGLLRKMQDAYRVRAAAVRELEAEREAQGEEMAETELRIRSFKSQLESMAAKAVEQEQAMQQLVAELQAEKTARREAEERLLGRGVAGKVLAEGPLITEDLCVDNDDEGGGVDGGGGGDERKRWRNSDGTMRSDLSIDTSAGTSVTDGESVEVDSIFSRSRSPTATVTTESEIPPTPSPQQQQQQQQQDLLAIRSPHTTKPKPQLSTFQKLVKGISGGNSGDNATDGCGNCRGQDASVAWDTVSLLRDENKSLKHRVAQLEVVVEGALDVVNGIGV
ncbi:hypothetical protein K445DRAFT_79769 [Daldinia sp. EC12]|nr:hypothetical protein K445DRAFT_79769 [Daldinia sp. EC12]